MKYNTINSNKIFILCQEIEDTSNEIFEYISKINELIEVLPIILKTEETVKFCEMVKNNQMVILRKYCNKMLFIKEILTKVNLAYCEVDDQFSSKQII